LSGETWSAVRAAVTIRTRLIRPAAVGSRAGAPAAATPGMVAIGRADSLIMIIVFAHRPETLPAQTEFIILVGSVRNRPRAR
jgi:hypothetical protein